jgi:hypothetical protein
MLSHDGRLRGRKLDHLETAVDPSPDEVSSTARTGLDGMHAPLVDLRHALPSAVVPVIPLLPWRVLTLTLGPLTRPGARQGLGWSWCLAQSGVLSFQECHLLPKQGILLLQSCDQPLLLRHHAA